jgi:putative endonuclease
MNRVFRAIAKRFDRTLRCPISLVRADGESWDKDELGRRGEQLAARWLKLEGGCKILYRNFKPPDGGEVDLVCRHDDVLVFAEVKTRTSDLFGRPAAAVTADKRELIIRGAREWLRLLDNPQIVFRFDIVEVRLGEGAVPDINWLQGAFNIKTRS